MSIRRIAYSSAWLLASIAAVCLSGCHPPRLDTISKDSVTDGDQQVPITLTGANFTNRCKIVVDGSPDGIGTGITLDAPLGFISETELDASLDIAANTPPGAHDIAVGDHTGISDPQQLYVSCVGCPPPPRLVDVSDKIPNVSVGARLSPLLRGTSATLTITGKIFQNNNPTVFVSGSAFAPSSAVVTDPTSGLDSFDLDITVAPDAATGFLELRVLTSGGRSNRLLLTVLAAPIIPRITGVTVAGSNPCALRVGLNDLIITGQFFDLSTQINLDYVYGGVVHEIGSNTVLTDPRTISTQVYVGGSTAPDSFSVRAFGVGGHSDDFVVSCNPGGLPVLHRLSPQRVTGGTDVYLKIEGENLDNIALFVESPAAQVIDGPFTPVTADPKQVIVVKLRAFVSASESSAMVYCRNLAGQLSNPLGFRIDEPSVPYIQTVTPDFITQGADADITIHGSNLLPLDAPFLRFSTPGVTISNVTVDPNLADMTCHVHADLSAALTNDEATNLVLFNPVGFKIVPLPAPGPVLNSITPTHVTKGSRVFIKCEGTGFGSNPFVYTDPVIGSAGRISTTHADQSQLVVGLLDIPANFSGNSLMITVKDTDRNLTSNALALSVDDRVANKPFIARIVSQALGVTQGTTAHLQVGGANLTGITNESWHTAVPGLQFSATSGGPTNVFFNVTADSNAPLTGDEATNVTAEVLGVESNPFALFVYPP
jgi:hypothetical protein